MAPTGRAPVREPAGGTGDRPAIVTVALHAPTLRPNADNRRHTEIHESPTGFLLSVTAAA